MTVDPCGSIATTIAAENGNDTPMLAFDGTSTSANRIFQDYDGSVMLTTHSDGSLVGFNTYDEYGIPGANNVGRFGYTGQMWLSEVGLNYYKARMYSPVLGRFLQTDPIGYGDGMNWYNYVGGDPVNGTDPSGEFMSICTFSVRCGIYKMEGSVTIGSKSTDDYNEMGQASAIVVTGQRSSCQFGRLSCSDPGLSLGHYVQNIQSLMQTGQG